MKRIILLIFVLAIGLLLSGCDLELGKYQVGDIGPSGVGKVFLVTDGGFHGLEVAPNTWHDGSSDPTSVWVEGGDTQSTYIMTPPRKEIGLGFENSQAIVAAEGHTTSAAALCRDYRSDDEGDWFLPSQNELELMYLMASIDIIGNFENDEYWSSSDKFQYQCYKSQFQHWPTV
ncbi:MAG: hypothetical protein U5P10_14620 [Spirochaetia bacterium]|nr:hypothetical protein [Spirochaetia bacterium]